jgi:hypothetical protein
MGTRSEQGPFKFEFLYLHDILQLANCSSIVSSSSQLQATVKYFRVLRNYVHQSRCSRFRTFVIVHFNSIVLTPRDWFRLIGVKPYGWRGDFPLFPAVAQTTFSSVKLRLALTDGDCLCASWQDPQPIILRILCSTKCHCYIETNLSRLLVVLYEVNGTRYVKPCSSVRLSVD